MSINKIILLVAVLAIVRGDSTSSKYDPEVPGSFVSGMVEVVDAENNRDFDNSYLVSDVSSKNIVLLGFDSKASESSLTIHRRVLNSDTLAAIGEETTFAITTKGRDRKILQSSKDGYVVVVMLSGAGQLYGSVFPSSVTKKEDIKSFIFDETSGKKYSFVEDEQIIFHDDHFYIVAVEASGKLVVQGFETKNPTKTVFKSPVVLNNSPLNRDPTPKCGIASGTKSLYCMWKSDKRVVSSVVDVSNGEATPEASFASSDYEPETVISAVGYVVLITSNQGSLSFKTSDKVSGDLTNDFPEGTHKSEILSASSYDDGFIVITNTYNSDYGVRNSYAQKYNRSGERVGNQLHLTTSTMTQALFTRDQSCYMYAIDRTYKYHAGKTDLSRLVSHTAFAELFLAYY